MALAIDGSASITTSGLTASVTLTTTQSNDLIVVDVLGNGTPIVSVTATGLTFTRHATNAGGASGIERWSAVAASPLSSVSITATQTSSAFISVVAYGISGANTASPYDSGGPQTSASFPVDGNLPITTTNANTMVIATFRMAATGTPTAGSGGSTYTAIAPITGGFMISEFQVESSTGTFTPTLTTGAGDSNGGIVDAVVAAGAGDTLGGAMPTLMMSRRRRDPVKTLLLPSRWRRRTRGFALAA